MKRVVSKVPGKIILIGEHAVVYGHPAIIIPHKKYMTCKLTKRSQTGIRYTDKKFNIDKVWRFEEIIKFNTKGKVIPIIPLIQEFCRYYKLDSFPNINIEIKSELPIGGFGASTALVICIFQALVNWFDLRILNNKLYDLTLDIESKFQNYQPSGVDHACIIHNSPIWYQKSKPKNIIKKIKIDKNILERIEIIDSGRPKNTTGEVVNWVALKMQKNPTKINYIFNEITKYTYQLKQAFENIDLKKIGELIDKSGEELIKLGIVTKSTQKLIRKLQKQGEHVKLSGAGAINGEASGALIAFRD